MNKKATSTLNSHAVSKACIETVIKNDSALGAIRNHACEKTSLSQTIHEYAKGIDAMNFESCPIEFHQAFNAHKQAWLAMIRVTDNYSDIRGEMHDLFDQMEKGQHAEMFKKRLKMIWDTWGEIEIVMKKYQD